MAEKTATSTEPKAKAKAEGSKTVLVGCKLPHGLYLDLRDKGGNLVARQKLPGASNFTLPNPERKMQPTSTVHGDTITPIPVDHWEAWLKQNADHPAVRNGAIYARAKREDAEAQALEHERQNIGFNKVNPASLGVKKLSDDNKPE